MSFLFRKVEDVTTISKSQSLTSVIGEHKRLHLESSKQNYYIISLRAIIKAIFTSTEKRCKASVKKFERSPTVLAEWIEMKEALAKFQAERGNEMSDDKGSDDMASKAERKRKSDASPVEFCRRTSEAWREVTHGILSLTC